MDNRKAALQQQDQAMAGLADFDLPRTVVTRLARAQVSRGWFPFRVFVVASGLCCWLWRGMAGLIDDRLSLCGRFR